MQRINLVFEMNCMWFRHLHSRRTPGRCAPNAHRPGVLRECGASVRQRTPTQQPGTAGRSL